MDIDLFGVFDLSKPASSNNSSSGGGSGSSGKSSSSSKVAQAVPLSATVTAVDDEACEVASPTSGDTSMPASSTGKRDRTNDELVASKRRASGHTDALEVAEDGTGIASQEDMLSIVQPADLRPPAKLYPFQLDTFQRDAISYIDRDESVLVAAHTSAGKTAVAEYAIAKALRDKQRVIYTSPIKALSNQKYRDLQEEFKDVGLMTGDMTINPNAACLIMTTEILRSMLYRGSEVIREVAWVIYDEVHYMRDKERGVVWEESIILLPHKVRFVFLSATIPNSKEFVSWVTKIHKQPCHVVYTDYRPVPLQHFVFPAGADGLYLVVDEKSKFREDNFQKAMSILQGPSDLAGSDGGAPKKAKGKAQTKTLQSDLFKIVRLVMDRELDPCIVFSFSKKDCEQYALQMARMDFNSADEKSLVEQVFLNAMEALSEDDQKLPQVLTILPLLKRGIGIHHGGLLPILKEVIEILFQEGLIKCLFATETFSIGINMPAKTVVFTATRKFDGKDFRWITSGEYIQMSGRAGRRGKDDKGIVIQMLDEKMEPDVAKGMIYGASDPLFSSYRVSYNMLLNMMRVEDADPENILRASFHQFQQEQQSPELLQKADEYQREAEAISIDREDDVSEYQNLQTLLDTNNNSIADILRKPEHCLPFLQPGRVAYIRSPSGFCWGVVIRSRKSASQESSDDLFYSLDVCVEEDAVDGGSAKSCKMITINLRELFNISAIKLNIPNAKDFTRDSSFSGIHRSLIEVQRRFPQEDGGLPMLDAVKDMGIVSENYKTLIDRKTEIQAQLSSSIGASLPNLKDSLALLSAKSTLLASSRELKQQAKESQILSAKEDVRKMKRVLRRMQYITEDGVLGLKGRFACELSTGDELVLTDLIFDGVFNELSADQTVALLSCFVHKEGQSDDRAAVPAPCQKPFHQLQATATTVCKYFNDAKITVDEAEYVKSFNAGLMEVSFQWSSGAKFIDICKLTNVFEGSIIRSIRRLEELLRQLASAAVAIGNHELKTKFEEGAQKIRRGVVFASSLYL